MEAWPIMYLKKNTDTNDSKANDATHEGAHIMTCGKNHVIDGNTKADDTWHHPTDSNNALYPYNPFPDPCDPNRTK